VDRKIEMMKIYKSELAEHPIPGSIDSSALDKLHGAPAGFYCTEVFMNIKETL